MKKTGFILPAILICILGMSYHTGTSASGNGHRTGSAALCADDSLATDSIWDIDTIPPIDTIAPILPDDTIGPDLPIDTVNPDTPGDTIVPNLPIDTVTPPDTVPEITIRRAVPITTEQFSIPDSISFDAEDNDLRHFIVTLSEAVSGKLKIREGLKARLILIKDSTQNDCEEGNPDSVQVDLTVDPDIVGEGENEGEAGDSTVTEITAIDLIPDLHGNECIFYPVENITDGNWEIEIPEGYFEVIPDFVDVDEFDFENEDFSDFKVCGAWHFKSTPWTGPGMFTIHDDDCQDGYIPSSKPSPYMTTGYYSLLYPILQSLGLRGCISMEGRRVGFSRWGTELNDNGKTARRLQDEVGWEIQNHSMDCIGEILNNWVVDSLSSSIADEILKKYPYSGIHQNATSVFDRQTGKQYFPLPDNSGWQESPSTYIKPYAGDFVTKRPVLYNPDFDLDCHWGRLFDLGPEYGLNVNCYVCYNASSSHALIPHLNEICPYGFADSSDILYNVPPLMSSATRLGLEGQVLKGYIGDNDTVNTFNQEHFEFFKKQIDECREKGGWIVFYTHMYRRCWKNHIPGALVSEGGTYPDEWVDPMLGTDPLNDPLDPPARLGISDWSEWFPCPGSRCDMIWQLFKYALDSGMINVTSSEGFENFGNKKSVGYFSYGVEIGQNIQNIEGTSKYYPHFVQGVNGEAYYYKPFVSGRISRRMNVSTLRDEITSGIQDITIAGCKNPDSQLTAVSLTGMQFKIDSLRQLPKGLWIVNGKKIIIR